MRTSHWAAKAIGLAAVALVASSAGGTERYVSASGSESGGYVSWATAAKTIQAAVDACVDGDVVWVTNGTYSVTSQVSVTKGITVASVNGASVTAIDSGGTSRCLFVSATNAVVDGFTIRNGYLNVFPQDGAGVLIHTNGFVRNSVISDNKNYLHDGGGVTLKGGGTVQNCLIVNNYCSSSGWGGGVYIKSAGSIENCTILGNTNSHGSGICTDGGGLIVNSIVQSNVGSDNISFGGGSVSYSCMTPLVAGTGNVTNDPNFASGFRLSAGSPCVDKGTNLSWMVGAADLDGNDRIINGTVDMGAYEVGFYVGIRYSAVDVTWNSVSGITYQVQYCANLSSPAWTNVGSSVTASGTSCYVYDWIRDSARKFYRVQQVP